VIAGRLLAGPFALGDDLLPLLAVMGSSFCLYSSGVVLNDVVDVETDRIARPDRPLPGGAVSDRSARLLCFSLAAMGLVLAFSAGREAFFAASAVLFLVLAYDLHAKRRGLLGALVLGGCRFGNVLLGAAASGAGTSPEVGFAGLLAYPELAHAVGMGLFALALTAASLSEEETRQRRALAPSVGLLILCVIVPGLRGQIWSWVLLLPLAAILVVRGVSALRRTGREPVERLVRSAVLGISVLDAGALLAWGHVTGAGAVLGIVLLTRLMVRFFPT
jgi:4-hydroxybenzoate polyprenyltransferase